MPLPHDFRAQARQPIPVNGKGAPLQISGTKLQENFEYLDKKEGGNGLDGSLTVQTYEGTDLGKISWEDGLVVDNDVVVTLPAVDGLPSGSEGDMLYHDGTDWVILYNPGEPTYGYKWILQQAPYMVPEWVEYKEITVSICEDGTPTEYTILGIPTA